MSWKNNNKTLQILKGAERGRYGVLATVAYTLDHVIAMIRAAENKRAPLIIQFFPWAIEHTNGDLIRAARILADRATIPIALHIDHAQDIEMIKRAAVELPLDSIMIDMSHYEKEENLKRTRELVQLCNKHQIATEAEPGRIEGGEDGVLDTKELEGILTTREDAAEFIATGIDILSPAIGNIHGNYSSSGPQLRFDLLSSLEHFVHEKNISLCLHGTNDFTPELLQRCVDSGISKINVNKLVLDTHLAYFEENASKVPLTELFDQSNLILVKSMEQWMDATRSSGKA